MSKKLFVHILSLAMSFAGCSTEPTNDLNPVGVRPLENVVYNETTETYMMPRNDPYTLANFQQAYDRLSAGLSDQTPMRAQADEFSAAEPLAPTHYALNIYPRDEKEQGLLETMEDIQMAYLPFDHVQLTQEEIASLAQTRATVAAFEEKNPYTVTYEGYQTTGEGPTEPKTSQLPILYTVWPVDKPLPEEMDYRVDYEIFLPDYDAPQTRSGGLSAEALQMLEREALALAWGSSVEDVSVSTRVTGHVATVMAYDDFLKKNVPLTDLKARFQSGSRIRDVYTDSNGNFTVDPSYTQLTFIYQDWRNGWNITTESSTNPYSVAASPLTMNHLLTDGSRKFNSIHRAVNYYYYGPGYGLPNYSANGVYGGIRIIADSRSNPDNDGIFCYYESHSSLPWIEIYNNQNNSGKVIGTTLHEIGHFVHYWDGRSTPVIYNFAKIHKLVKESWASYVGWYVGEEYFKSQGWVKPVGYSDITGQARQSWRADQTSVYSPLFVDMTDDYDETFDSFYSPMDRMSGVKPSYVWMLVRSCPTVNFSWEVYRMQLERYVRVVGFYSEVQFYNAMSAYDQWFANNE